MTHLISSKLKPLIDAFGLEFVNEEDVNVYCENCNKECKELIETFNCNEQMNNANLEKILTEFQNCNNLINNTITVLIDEMKRDTNGEQTVNTVINSFNSLSKKDQGVVFRRLFGLDNLGSKVDSKLLLLSFIVSTHILLKKKDPNSTIRKAIDLLVDHPNAKDDYKDKLEFMAEEFAYGVEEGNTFGLKNVSEVKQKVNEIISHLLPF